MSSARRRSAGQRGARDRPAADGHRRAGTAARRRRAARRRGRATTATASSATATRASRRARASRRQNGARRRPADARGRARGSPRRRRPRATRRPARRRASDSVAGAERHLGRATPSSARDRLLDRPRARRAVHALDAVADGRAGRHRAIVAGRRGVRLDHRQLPHPTARGSRSGRSFAMGHPTNGRNAAPGRVKAPMHFLRVPLRRAYGGDLGSWYPVLGLLGR